jgi:hypothetical protein
LCNCVSHARALLVGILQVTNFPACALQRKLREECAHGKKFRGEILKSASVFIPDRILAKDLTPLIRLCNGTVAGANGSAKVILTTVYQPKYRHATQALPLWIYDSIANGEMQDLEKYKLSDG